jgi:hypothetical protein
MKSRLSFLTSISLAIILAGFALHAQKPSTPAPKTEGTPTQILVRAVSHDAKIISSKVGGAKITIKNAATGAILAQGIQKGESGDTRKIMLDPHKRGEVLYDTLEAAGFLATINLSSPTVVEIIAEGPLGAPQAMQRASKTMLLVPGQDILGEGIILEINGLIVTFVTPDAKLKIIAGDEVDVKATVTMSCGCPTEPGGIWDASKMKIFARIIQAGKIAQEVPMTFANETSTFVGKVKFETAGPARLEVLAMDAGNANFGIVKRTYTVAKLPPPPPTPEPTPTPVATPEPTPTPTATPTPEATPTEVAAPSPTLFGVR